MKYKFFELKEEHLKLLHKAYWNMSSLEFGAAGMDPKRPYGNKDVYEDMITILADPEDIKKCPNCDCILEGKYTEEELRKLHDELVLALQVIFSTMDMKPGKYRSEEYSNRWEPVPEETEEST